MMRADELKINVLCILIFSRYRLQESRSVVCIDVYSTNKQSLWYTMHFVRFTVYVCRMWVAYHTTLVVHS